MVSKTAVNLIIRKETESPVLKKLNVIFPVLAILSLTVFVLIFLASIIYYNGNILKFNLIKREIESLEKKIGDQKTTEGVYTLSANRLNILNQMASQNPNFPKVLTEIDNLNSTGINILSAASDDKGLLSVDLIASSSSSLDDFVGILKKQEQKKLFSKIEAHGIVREKKGNYLLTITLLADPSILK